MNYNKKEFYFKIIEYKDKNLNLKYKKYIKVLLYYKCDCVLIFDFPPFKHEDENINLEGVYLSIKAKIGNIIKNDLNYRYTYHINQKLEINNKYRKNISFQLKINKFSEMLKDVISILITYYIKENKGHPKYLITKRVTGNTAKNKGEVLYCYNLNTYKIKKNLKENSKYIIVNSYKENLVKTIIE
jgi:hypothetical protein